MASFDPASVLEAVAMPGDAIEVGRVLDAWGVKGWLKILPHSASPEALFSSRRWYLQPTERGARRFEGCLLARVREPREHADAIVARFDGIEDRGAAESLRGARIFVPRSSFPSTAKDEYYWVDLIGLDVVNREGVWLGQVRELLSTGPQTVLVLVDERGSKPVERMVPFVSAYVDHVDLPGRCIRVDWQPDY